MKRKKELIVILSSLLVIVLSVSVAYFTTKILGTEKDISVTSADLKVTFTSGSGTINGTNIEPGWTSGENTFTVKNESNGTYKYNIIIKDLVNTFTTSGFLVYKITSTDGGYNMANFTDVPKSNTATDTTIAESISIEKGKTHTYKIIINYNNSDDVDQSSDMGKTLTGKIFIEESTFKGGTLSETMMYYNPVVSTRSDFSTPFTTNTVNTLYKAKENNKDVYYFAGIDGTPAHCEYQGNIILNYDENNPITEKICTSNFTACKNGYGITYGDSSCDMHDGFDYTVTDAQWITSENKPINNWVKFGKNSSNQDLYWRIIRTNSDGSIRLLYHGTSTAATDAYIGTSKFNTKFNSPKYVGYMYGNSDTTPEEARTNTNDSTIKTLIDNWYANNMTSYTKYLSTTAVYCNDREVGSGTYSATGSTFYYAAYTRLSAKTPTYDCTNDNDKFTVDASSGNGKLTYPIGLMTADEISFAGGVYNKDAQAYYYYNSAKRSSTGDISWYTMSPYSWGGTYTLMFVVNGSSYLLKHTGDNLNGARPVISLKSCIKYSTGNGTSETPYEIVETSSGC